MQHIKPLLRLYYKRAESLSFVKESAYGHTKISSLKLADNRKKLAHCVYYVCVILHGVCGGRYVLAWGISELSDKGNRA